MTLDGKISLTISIAALLISLITLIINFKKYKIDKSNIRIKILDFKIPGNVFYYPSMENDDSSFILELEFTNSGYKDELLTNIRTKYKKKDFEIDYKKTIAAKSQLKIELEFKRFEIMQLKEILAISSEGKKIRNKKRDLKEIQKKMLSHIENNRREWKNGKKI